tara:strand:+ start:2064 stop:2210 length:147 start_codon:yes stop_codon:yes gene_type:complete
MVDSLVAGENVLFGTRHDDVLEERWSFEVVMLELKGRRGDVRARLRLR